jgi:hypothetical protein
LLLASDAIGLVFHREVPLQERTQKNLTWFWQKIFVELSQVPQVDFELSLIIS